MVRSCTIFACLALVACAAGAAAHFYFGLSRVDAGWLTLGGVGLGLLYAVTSWWKRRRVASRSSAEPQGPSTAVLAYRVMELECRLAALEMQVAAANPESPQVVPGQQDPVLRARARAELALAAAAIERQ
jgi:hypothetical protein